MTDLADDPLTDTERRVVDLRIQGKTYAEIGAELGFSKQAAWEHGQKEHVKAAIRGEHADIIAATKERVAKGYQVGLDALIEIAGKRGHKDRLGAARKLVEMVDPIKSDITVSERAQRDAAAKLAKEIVASMDD